MSPSTVSRSVALNPECCHLAIALWTGFAPCKMYPSTKLGVTSSERAGRPLILRERRAALPQGDHKPEKLP